MTEGQLSVEAETEGAALGPGEEYGDFQSEVMDLDKHDATFHALLTRYAAANPPWKLTFKRTWYTYGGWVLGTLIGGLVPGSVFGMPQGNGYFWAIEAATVLVVVWHLVRRRYRKCVAELDFANDATAVPYEVLAKLETTSLPGSLRFKLIDYANNHGAVPMRLYNEWRSRRQEAKDAAVAGDMDAAESLVIYALRADGIQARRGASTEH